MFIMEEIIKQEELNTLKCCRAWVNIEESKSPALLCNSVGIKLRSRENARKKGIRWQNWGKVEYRDRS
jgi:hypothetical protein